MLHAPDVVDAEILHALRGLVLGGKIRADRAEQARDLFRRLPIRRYPVRLIADRVWALRDNLTVFDACFVALAEVLSLPLVTADRKLWQGSTSSAAVEVFPPLVQ